MLKLSVPGNALFQDLLKLNFKRGDARTVVNAVPVLPHGVRRLKSPLGAVTFGVSVGPLKKPSCAKQGDCGAE